MATSTTKPTRKPAVKAEKPATEKPAEQKPAEQSGLTLKDLAKAVDKDPKAVRRQIRKIKGGKVVGQGGRYHWDSEKDPDYVELLAALTSK